MNIAEKVLAECWSRGIQLTATGKVLRYEAPKGTLTPELRKILKAHKREILATLRSKNDGHQDWNDLPDGPPCGSDVGAFNQEAIDVIRAGGKVPVWSDVLFEWLCWVRDEEARQQLLSEGCEVVIYTLGELELVAGWDAPALKEVHDIKKTFGGTIEPPPEAG